MRPRVTVCVLRFCHYSVVCLIVPLGCVFISVRRARRRTGGGAAGRDYVGLAVSQTVLQILTVCALVLLV